MWIPSIGLAKCMLLTTRRRFYNDACILVFSKARGDFFWVQRTQLYCWPWFITPYKLRVTIYCSTLKIFLVIPSTVLIIYYSASGYAIELLLLLFLIVHLVHSFFFFGMKIQLAIGFLVSAAVAVSAATDNIDAVQETKLFRVPISKKKIIQGGPPIASLSRRAQYKENLYIGDGSIYMVNVAIGTPPQNFELVLDTGRFVCLFRQT